MQGPPRSLPAPSQQRCRTPGTPLFPQDYRTPEISLFTEENGEGTRLRFTGSAEDTRTRGQALAAASIIVHSGL